MRRIVRPSAFGNFVGGWHKLGFLDHRRPSGLGARKARAASVLLQRGAQAVGSRRHLIF